MSLPKLVTRREILLGAASMIAGDLILRAQQTSRTPVPTFSVNVDVVNVFVTVRNKRRSIVKDLAQEELRSQYSLGYTPDANAGSGYRKIKIEVKKKGMVARGREGYYPHAKS